MRLISMLLSALALSTGIGATPAAAQEAALVEPRPHQGYYLSLGLYGVGAIADDEDLGGLGPSVGFGANLRAGQALTSWFDLGVGLAFASAGGDDPLSFGRLTIQTQLYFADAWFARGALGFGFAQGEDPLEEEDPGRVGDVYVLGVGGHIFLTDCDDSGGWALSPVAAIELGPDDDFLTAGLWLGLEIVYWTGLPSERLELPLDRAYQPLDD